MPSPAGGGAKSVAPVGPVVKPCAVGMLLEVAVPPPDPVVGAPLGEPIIMAAPPLLGLLAGVLEPVPVPALEPIPLPVAPGFEFVFDAAAPAFTGVPVAPPPAVPEVVLLPPLWLEPGSGPVPPPNPPPLVGALLHPISAKGNATINLATGAMVLAVHVRTMIHLRMLRSLIGLASRRPQREGAMRPGSGPKAFRIQRER